MQPDQNPHHHLLMKLGQLLVVEELEQAVVEVHLTEGLEQQILRSMHLLWLVCPTKEKQIVIHALDGFIITIKILSWHRNHCEKCTLYFDILKTLYNINSPYNFCTQYCPQNIDRIQIHFQPPERCIVKHLKNTKLNSIKLLRTKMTSHFSNYHRESSISVLKNPIEYSFTSSLLDNNRKLREF